MSPAQHRLKLYIHIVEIVLIIMVIGFSVPRLFMKNQPRTRANTIALSMGAKSLVLIAYQLLTEHVARMRRWASTKANTIINCLEIVLWAAVVFLVIQANISVCSGISCTLSWVVMALSIIMTLCSVATAYISWVDHREQRFRRRMGSDTVTPGEQYITKEVSPPRHNEV